MDWDKLVKLAVLLLQLDWLRRSESEKQPEGKKNLAIDLSSLNKVKFKLYTNPI